MIRFCSLYSGSSGNSLFVAYGKTKILIDCGVSGKKVKEALKVLGEEPEQLSAILVSHEHVDHIKGIGVLSRNYNIPIYANEKTWEAIGSCIGPIDIRNRLNFNTGEKFEIGDIQVDTFHIPHDAAEPVGYSFYAGSKKICIATDIGHVDSRLISNFIDSDLLVLESNHDVDMLKAGPYPFHLKRRILSDVGHLSNESAGQTIAYMVNKGVEKFVLGHLSRDNNFPELALETVISALKINGINPLTDVVLDVAEREFVSSLVVL